MVDQLLTGKRVLVVEDEMLVLMAIEDLLADLGCTSVTRAANIEQALQAIEGNAFDLATLDLNLDGKRSYSVAEALEDHGVPFTFSSGYGARGLEEGYDTHPMLNKPFNQAQVVRVLTALVEAGGARSARTTH